MASLSNRCDPDRVDRKLRREFREIADYTIGNLQFLIAEKARRDRAERALNPKPRKKF